MMYRGMEISQEMKLYAYFLQYIILYFTLIFTHIDFL